MKKEFIVNIDKIKQKYDCKGELIFRSALCLLLDYGKERCGNIDWVNDNKELTKKTHREAAEQGKHLFINERLEIAIMDCAYELAQFSWELFEYIQTEMQTDWQTPTYKKLGEQIKYLCAIVKSYNGNNVSEILDEWGIDQEVLSYLELNEYLKEEE
jgi:hypothetical protein